jgi:cytochrome c oxidase subunit 4
MATTEKHGPQVEIVQTGTQAVRVDEFHSDAKGDVHPKKPGEGTYVTIFVILAALTVVELLVVYLPGVRVPLLLGLACGKAWLVLQYYMHLRYEARWLTWAFIVPVVTGALVTLFITPLVQ